MILNLMIIQRSDYMRIYRNGIFLSALMCIISFVALLINIVIYHKFNIKMDSTIENLLLGVFASSFVVLVTYIGAYLIEKKKTVGYIKRYCFLYIEEMSNFVPMVSNISATTAKVNMIDAINAIKTDKNVHDVVVKLCKIHEERLYTVEGFFPLNEKCKWNAKINKLLFYFAKINTAFQYFDLIYKKNNNVIYQREQINIECSDEETIKYLKMVLPIENNDYATFLSLLSEVSKKYRGKYIFDADSVEKYE